MERAYFATMGLRPEAVVDAEARFAAYFGPEAAPSDEALAVWATQLHQEAPHLFVQVRPGAAPERAAYQPGHTRRPSSRHATPDELRELAGLDLNEQRTRFREMLAQNP